MECINSVDALWKFDVRFSAPAELIPVKRGSFETRGNNWLYDRRYSTVTFFRQLLRHKTNIILTVNNDVISWKYSPKKLNCLLAF